MTETQTTIELPSNDSAISISGSQEENLKLLTRETGARLVLRSKSIELMP